MDNEAPQTEAEIIHDLPHGLASKIGLVVAAYSHLEHNMFMVVTLLLQLQRPEARIALRNGRPTDLLDTALSIFALRQIPLDLDTQEIRQALNAAKSERDYLAHGIWMRHPRTGQIYLRIAKGHWKEKSDDGHSVSRVVFPQAVPFGDQEADNKLRVIEHAITLVHRLGKAVDSALFAFPERFRQPAPILDPLARRRFKPTQNSE